MYPRTAGVLCLLAVLLCCCTTSTASDKKTKDQLMSQVNSVVQNLKIMNSKRGMGSAGISREALSQVYQTELELRLALLQDPGDLDLQEALRELKAAARAVQTGRDVNFPQVRSKADVPKNLARILKEREAHYGREEPNQVAR